MTLPLKKMHCIHWIEYVKHHGIYPLTRMGKNMDCQEAQSSEESSTYFNNFRITMISFSSPLGIFL